MGLVICQNADFEEPGLLEAWAADRAIGVKVVRAFAGDPLPEPRTFSHLIVLGAPLDISDLAQTAWLQAEADWLRACLGQQKKILGICFGAQLLAHLLGGEVRAGNAPEIGWHEVDFHALPGAPSLWLFQWHGDIFTLPPGALPLARSAATPIQGFTLGENVWALAGHPEIDEKLLESYIERCWSEDWFFAKTKAGQGRFVQRPERMREEAAAKLPASRPKILRLLDLWAGQL